MPLLDHFHPPLSVHRFWDGFLGQFMAAVGDQLNGEVLPQDYVAEMFKLIGTRSVEAELSGTARPGPGGYVPPAAEFVMPTVFPDAAEVRVQSLVAGPELVAAVKFATPVNKGGEKQRVAFASQCAAYLQRGIGLIVVDIVTNRSANLHNYLADLLGLGECFFVPPAPLYAAAYRPRRMPRKAPSPAERIDVWTSTLAVGRSLPVLPLALDAEQVIPVDLDRAYMIACQRSRLL